MIEAETDRFPSGTLHLSRHVLPPSPSFGSLFCHRCSLSSIWSVSNSAKSVNCVTQSRGKATGCRREDSRQHVCDTCERVRITIDQLIIRWYLPVNAQEYLQASSSTPHPSSSQKSKINQTPQITCPNPCRIRQTRQTCQPLSWPTQPHQRQWYATTFRFLGVSHPFFFALFKFS